MFEFNDILQTNKDSTRDLHFMFYEEVEAFESLTPNFLRNVPFFIF